MQDLFVSLIMGFLSQLSWLPHVPREFYMRGVCNCMSLHLLELRMCLYVLKACMRLHVFQAWHVLRADRVSSFIKLYQDL